MKRIKLKDIAKISGFDISTCSRALRDDPRVKAETKKKIKKIAEELDYIPDISGRTLSAGKSGIIGIILPEIKHSFYSEIFEEIDEICVERELIPELLLTEFNQFRIENIKKQIKSQRMDGVIIAYHSLDFSFIEEKVCPVVLIDVAEEEFGSFDKVIIDNVRGAKEAVEYLVEIGHKKIGFISDTITTGKRFEGYKIALEENNLEIEDDLIEIRSGRSEEIGYQAGLKLLSKINRPTAIFCVNDLIAIGLMRASFEMNIKIPEQLSVVGFDDLPVSRYLPIPLTTVSQPIKDIAGAALSLLINRIKNPFRTFITKKLQTNLTIRKSTSPFLK
ncbi:MAG: LacI family transcriptional regulator [Candidatus Omnitrophica bacterium]|nr:LacI family transcriptional regulator [Candidatus Omnitrophota bacterium]